MRLLEDDDLASDDFARLVVPAPKQLRVALVGELAWFMQKLLEAQAYASLDLLSPDQYDSAVAGGEAWDVVVFLDRHPTRWFPAATSSSTSVIGLDAIEPFGSAEKVFVRSAQDEHPAFRFVILDDLFVWKMLKVVAADDATVLTDAVEGPMIAEIDKGGVQAIWVGFHPLDSTWWRQRSFAIFVPNAIEYLASIGGAVVEKGLLPGEGDIDAASGRRAAAATVTRPDGTSEALSPLKACWCRGRCDARVSTRSAGRCPMVRPAQPRSP